MTFPLIKKLDLKVHSAIEDKKNRFEELQYVRAEDLERLLERGFHYYHVDQKYYLTVPVAESAEDILKELIGSLESFSGKDKVDWLWGDLVKRGKRVLNREKK